MHEEVQRRLHASNAKYKQDVDHSRRSFVFYEGDLVWVLLCRERFPIGMYSKLKQKKIGPCHILKKINDNAYKVNLPLDVKTSNVFNVEDLTPYKGEEPLVDVLDDEEESNSRSTSSQDGETDEDPILLLAEHFLEMYEKRRKKGRALWPSNPRAQQPSPFPIFLLGCFVVKGISDF